MLIFILLCCQAKQDHNKTPPQMVSSSKSKPITFLFLTLIIFLISFPHVSSSTNNINPISDHNKLVYTHCPSPSPSPNQTIQTPPKFLPSLLQELVEKSSNSKFYETNLGDDTTAISGLFQCKDHLTNQQCHDCVNMLPNISNTLCGHMIPARVQLSGCYVHYDYEPDGGTAPAKVLIRHDVLQHKVCGEPIGELGGFQEVRYGAFEALLACVLISSSHGYCDTWYESMHVVAQCEGGLGGCECGECVTSAVQVAQDECGHSASGEIYMGSCYISFVYEAHGLPGDYVPGKNQGGIASAKLVAIVIGGGAALGAGLLFCFCIRASRKKHDDW